MFCVDVDTKLYGQDIPVNTALLKGRWRTQWIIRISDYNM